MDDALNVSFCKWMLAAVVKSTRDLDADSITSPQWLAMDFLAEQVVQDWRDMRVSYVGPTPTVDVSAAALDVWIGDTFPGSTTQGSAVRDVLAAAYDAWGTFREGLRDPF